MTTIHLPNPLTGEWEIIRKERPMGKRLDQERQQRLLPKRMERALRNLRQLGIEPVGITDTSVTFVWKGSNVTFYPYSGWATGKTIKDGRGHDNLFRQLHSVRPHRHGHIIENDRKADQT